MIGKILSTNSKYEDKHRKLVFFLYFALLTVSQILFWLIGYKLGNQEGYWLVLYFVLLNLAASVMYHSVIYAIIKRKEKKQ